jgi:hypothetical protein
MAPSDDERPKRRRSSTLKGAEAQRQRERRPPQPPAPPTPRGQSTPRLRLSTPAGPPPPALTPGRLHLSMPRPPGQPPVQPTGTRGRQAAKANKATKRTSNMPPPPKPPSSTQEDPLSQALMATGALRAMEARDTPPPNLPTSSQLVNDSFWNSTTPSQRAGHFAIPHVRGSLIGQPDSDDDLELAQSTHATTTVAGSQQEAVIVALVPDAGAPDTGAPDVQVLQRSPSVELFDCPITIFFVIDRVHGKNGYTGDNITLCSIPLSLTMEQIILTPRQFSALGDPIQEKVREWNIKNSRQLGTPKVIARPLFNRLPNRDVMSYHVNTRNEWEPCIKAVQRFNEQGKTEIRVYLTYQYTYPTALPSSQQSQPPQSLTAGGHIGGRGDIPLEASTGRLTTTQRQLRSIEAENSLDPKQQQIEELGVKWTCKIATCKNISKFCWWEQANEHKHYPLHWADLKTWVAQMLKDPSATRITFETPPPNVYEQIIKDDKNDQRAKKKASAKATATVDVNTFTESSKASAPIININTGGMESINALLTHVFTRDLPSSSGYTANARTTPAPSLPPEPSSSPISNGPNNTIDNYLDWLIDREPMLHQELEDTRTILLDKHIPLTFIHAYKHRSESEWEKLGITVGIGWRLSQNIKIWQRELHAEAQSRRTHIPHTPPRATSLAVRPSPHKNRGQVIYQSRDPQEEVSTQDEEEYPGQNEIFTDNDDELQ